MLPYGLKVAWFALSLSGLLSGWASFHAFARAVRAFWVPVVYCSANTILQGIFCLGLIWRLNPSMMPHAFCVAQTTLMQASWACITGVCAVVSLSTASRVLTTKARVLQWFCTPASRILLVLAFPTAVLVSQLVALVELHAAQPTDDMHCDASHPIWVRVLGYSGASLLLAIPSFVLSIFIALRISTHRRNQRQALHNHRLSFDTFTPLPMRRQSKRSSLVVSTPSIYSIQDTPPSPLSPVSTNLNFTGSDPSIPHVVPSRSHSPSANNVLTPPGRAKTISSRARYHLPSDWITPYRTSPASEDQVEIQARGREESRFTPSSMSRRSTYSPIIFANSNNNSNNDVARASPLHSRSQSRGPTPSIMMGTHSRGPSRLGGGAERESPSILLRGEEEKIGMKFQVHGFTWDGQFILDSEDCVSGSLRWAKIDGDEETSSIKTGMQLAEEDEDENLPTYMRRQSIELGPWRQIPPRLSSAGPLWRIIAFQLFLSLSQIIAPISSLNDMATHKANPSPFGTQHVALLMMAWAPCLVFGFDISWRREG